MSYFRKTFSPEFSKSNICAAKRQKKLSFLLRILAVLVFLSAFPSPNLLAQDDLSPEEAAAQERYIQQIAAAKDRAAQDGYTLDGVLNTVYEGIFGPAAPGAVLVVDDDLACPGAIYPTIQAAVTAANPGDVIQVCAGTYPETVTTNKNLTFLGPQAGVDPRTGRTTPGSEAVVGIAGGAFNLQLTSGMVTLDGFTLTGANTSNGDGAALLLLNGNGHQIVNNIFDANQRAAFFSSPATTFKFNRINSSFDGFFGGGNDATIEENTFTGAYPDGAINTTNGAQSGNYKIKNNSFNATGNFIVVFNTLNGQISGNVGTGTSNSVIFIGGGNTNLTVSGNTLTGNNSSAISFSGEFGYPADSGINITSNTLTGNLRGINFGTGANATTGIVVQYNRIVGNSVAGINTTSIAAVNANDNWWGCNYGPNATGLGCAGTTNGIIGSGSGSVTATTWLVLKSTPSMTATKFGGTPAVITSDLNTNSVNTPVTGFVPDTTPITFAATPPSLGSVSPTSATTMSGAATTTFTATNSAGIATVGSTVDGQTVNATINVDPVVTSIKRKTPLTQYTTASTVVYEVIFNAPVKNVDDTDFVVTVLNGAITGASVTAVSSGSPFTTYLITVSSYTGEGEIRLDLIDDDTIQTRTTNQPLGGTGAGNGNFNTGETYIIDINAPTVTIKQNPSQPDSTNVSPIVFDVVFSEDVGTSFATGDVTLSGTAGATTATVSGSGANYTVSVTGMTTTGTVIVNIPANVAQDLSGKPNSASTTGATINDDNLVNYFVGGIVLAVDDDGMASAASCGDSAPTYSTIQSAVAASGTGYTIKVCSGTYPLASTVNVPLANLTIIAAEATKPLIQVGGTMDGFNVTATGVTLQNLEIEKIGTGDQHHMVRVQANNFTGQSNFIHGPSWQTPNHVSRAFVFNAGITGILLNGNTITDLRQPAYFTQGSGTVSNNILSGTKGWVNDGGLITFTNNTFGQTCQACDTDIALLAVSTTPAYEAFYSPTNVLAISNGNNNAHIDVQFTAANDSGRAVSFVNAATGSAINDGRSGTPYAGIQQAIYLPTPNSVVSDTLPGGTVNVAAGTYAENLNVSRQLRILGPNETINPNTGTRVGEAILTTAVSDNNQNDCIDTGNTSVVTLAAEGIVIKGFTLDGNNAALTSGYVVNGSDIDAYDAIDEVSTTNPNADISNNIVKNFGEFGIVLSGNDNPGVRVNSTISNNKVDNVVGLCYGEAIRIGENAFANVEDNVITNSFNGVTVENFNGNADNPNPRPTSVIDDNAITVYGYAIYFNLHYNYTNPSFTVSDNTINSYVENGPAPLAENLAQSKTNEDVKNETPQRTLLRKREEGASNLGSSFWDRFIGIRIESIQQMAPVTFSGNTIAPNRSILASNGYTVIDGMRITNPSSTSPNIDITGNAIINTKRGIAHTAQFAVPEVVCNNFINNDVGVYIGSGIDYNGNPESAVSGILLNNNNLLGNSLFGVQADSGTSALNNAASNYWGASNGPGPVGPGSGDKVSTNVNFAPFLTAPTNCTPAAPPPTVTINQATGQEDPTDETSIEFDVVFSEDVTGFTTGDVTLSGTANATTATVTQITPSTYTVAVTGMANDGTVVVSIAGGVANGANGANVASTSTDNSVTYDATVPTVTINQAAGQPDPTSGSPINFTVVFSETVTGFATGDVILSGTAGATTAIVTGSGTTYNVAVSGMTMSGTVTASVPANVATDTAGNSNTASTSNDPTVTFSQEDLYAITATAPQQLLRFSSSNPNVAASTVTVTGLQTGETLYGIDFRPANRILYGLGSTSRLYRINVSTGSATPIGAAGAFTLSGTEFGFDFNPTVDRIRVVSNTGQNLRLHPDTGALVAADTTLNPATSGVSAAAYTNNDTDPVTGTTLYDIDADNDTLFIQNPPNNGTLVSVGALGTDVGEVNGFDISGVTTTAYAAFTDNANSGMSALYTINLATGAASRVGRIGVTETNPGNALNIRGLSAAPIGGAFIDVIPPTVTINQAGTQADPTSVSPINFTAVFNEAVTGFTTGDVTISGTAFGANSYPTGVVTQIAPNNGTTYNVAVSGMNQSGTVTVSIAAGVAVDIVGNPNTASTATDDTVTFNLVDTAVLVSPANTVGWTFVQETAGAASGTFVTGPPTPPIGTGSTRLTVDAAAGEAFIDTKPAYANVRFDQITNLSFSTYQTVTNGAAAAAFQFNLETDVTAPGANFQGRLIYEPYMDPTNVIQTGMWQNWNALESDAMFWASSNANTTVDDVCPQGNPCTRAELLAAFPNIGLRAFPAPSGPPVGVILFKVGGGIGSAFDGNVDNFTFGVNSATTTFNFEATPPMVSISDATAVTEGDSGTTPANFTVSLSTVSTLPTTVNVSTANGTATTANNDYVPVVNQVVTIPAGQLSAPFTVAVNGDNLVESDETFTVNLSNAANAEIADGQGTGTINNDDGFGTLQFSSATYSVTEGTPTASITITRAGGNDQAVSVDCSTVAGGSATGGGVDYTTVTNQTISFADQDSATKTCLVPITNDNIFELAETVNLSLSNPIGSTLGSPSSAVLTINDSGNFILISGNIQQYNAPSPNTNLAGVTVMLSGSASGTTTTDASGNYTFNGGLPSGSNNYLVTPSLAGKIFDPINRSYVNLTSNVTNANFVAYNTGAVPRNIRVVNTSQATYTSNVTVPIVIDSLGTENAMSFSLNYNPSLLAFSSAACGSDAPGCSFTTNSLSGSLGVEFERADDVMGNPTAFTAGNARQVILITFTTTPGTVFNTPITFGDSPAVRDVNDTSGNSLPTNYVNGSVIFAQGIEGDVAGRTTGNGALTSADVSVLRQFVAGTLTDPNFNEFQRSDVAPAGSKGGGTITSADVTVLRNYLANSILTPVGGPTQSVTPLTPFNPFVKTDDGSNAVAAGDVRVVNVSSSAGSSVSVPITLDSGGNENGVTISVQFDQSKLTYAGAALGVDVAGMPGTTFDVNQTQLASGRVGISFTLDVNQTFTPGLKRIIIINFNVVAGAPTGFSPITFVGQPLPLELNDPLGNTLPSTFTAGTVSINGPTSANASVGGRLTDASGNGIGKTTVTITADNGATRNVVTNSFGNYVFADLPVGQTYVISVSSKKYRFTPESRVVTVNGDATDVDFTADGN